MAQDVNRFMKELTDYMNTYIAGKENTCITKCTVSDKVLNRGHVILVKIKMPAGLKTKTNAGLCFYAEELMEEFAASTIAGTAEILNARIINQYPTFIQMMQAQNKNMEKTIDEYDKEDLIVTALPSDESPYHEGDESRFVAKELPEFGLTMIMKAKLCDNPDNENQSYFVPVRTKEGQEAADDD